MADYDDTSSVIQTSTGNLACDQSNYPINALFRIVLILAAAEQLQRMVNTNVDYWLKLPVWQLTNYYDYNLDNYINQFQIVNANSLELIDKSIRKKYG